MLGADSRGVRRKMAAVNRTLSRFCKRLPPRTTVIITADHGQIDRVGGTYLIDTPIFEMLSAPPSVEPTAISLRVKPE